MSLSSSSTLPSRVAEFAHVSPATRLLEKRRQVFEVQEALMNQKEDFARREEAVRRREDALRRKDVELQESLIRFNKFLQENENKKNRALKRVIEERRLREMKEGEIEVLQLRMSELKEEEASLHISVKKHQKYRDYLDSVSGSMTKMSSEIADILNRYKTLKDVNLQLIEAQSSAELTKESQQRELSFFSKAGANTILNNNNDISKLKELLEREHTEVLVTQSSMDKNLVESSAKTLELGQILSSIANMLSRCEESFRVRHNKPARLLEKTEGLSVGEQCAITMAMLEELGLFMVDFQSLVKEDAVMKADLAASLAY